jgi:hypothetical protein
MGEEVLDHSGLDYYEPQANGSKDDLPFRAKAAKPRKTRKAKS